MAYSQYTTSLRDVGAQGNVDRPLADALFMLDVAKILSPAETPKAMLDQLTQLCAARFCDGCSVYVPDRTGALTLAAIATGEPGAAILETLHTNPVAQDALHAATLAMVRCSPGSEILGDSVIVVPLRGRDVRLGAIAFYCGRMRPMFSERHLYLAEALALQVGIALRGLDYAERERRLTERFRFVARATERLLITLDERANLRLLVESLVEWFGDAAFAVSAPDDGLSAFAVAYGANADDFAVARYLESRVLGEKSDFKILASVTQRRSLLVNDDHDGLEHSWIAAPVASGERTYCAIGCYRVGRRYDERDLEALEEIGRRTALALQHAESFARERRLTQTLQQATLPTQLATIPGVTLSAVYIPAAAEERVGGDWYDAFDLDDHRVLVTIGDVTGHGLAASIIMGKLRHALNVVAMYESDPVRIIDVAEEIVLRRYPDAIATAFVAILDRNAQTITYANAGHPYPIARRRDGTLTELVAQGVPIGLRGLSKRSTLRSESRADIDLLLMYTDGLTEATRDPIAGNARLFDAVAKSAILYVRSAAGFVKACCLDDVATDDVAILAFNFLNEDRWSFSSEDSYAARKTRFEVSRRIREKFAGSVAADAAELILGELVANVVRHAPGSVDVSLEAKEDRAVLHVIDRGAGYELHVKRADDLFAENGRGLWLIRELGGELAVESVPPYGTHVSVVLPRP